MEAAFSSSFLRFALSSDSFMFNVPWYGMKPSFSFTCCLAHDSSRNFSPSPLPENTLPLSFIFFTSLEPQETVMKSYLLRLAMFGLFNISQLFLEQSRMIFC